MDNMSCSSQNSIPPTAQNTPDPSDGDYMNLEVGGRAHQINPLQANQNTGGSVTINNRFGPPGRNGAKRKGSSSGENSRTRKAQKKPNQSHGGSTMNLKIGGSAHQINPAQANQNSGDITVDNSHQATVGNATRDSPIGTDQKGSSSGENSRTRKAQKKPNQSHGGSTMNLKIGGSAHQINPIQANQNTGDLTVDNSHQATVGNPTRDSPISTDQKDEASLFFEEKLKLQSMSSSPRSGGTMTSEINDSAHQIDSSRANRNSGKTGGKRRRVTGK